MDPSEIAHFRTFGFVVLRSAFDAQRLRDELDRALDAGAASSMQSGVAEVQYRPMMAAHMVCSRSLLERFETAAASLIGNLVLPVRAKGMRYFGATAWHADSSRPIASLGFAAYLEPLRADSGALRVLPGSHRGEYAQAIAAYLAAAPNAAVDSLPGAAVSTEPGDVIAFDEHLFHASSGGTRRRQWRVDYVCDPRSGSDEDEVRAYFAQIFDPNWDGGYDVDAFPSYAPDWVESGAPAVARLGKLGVLDLAREHEGQARLRRRRKP